MEIGEKASFQVGNTNSGMADGAGGQCLNKDGGGKEVARENELEPKGLRREIATSRWVI